MSDAKPLVRQRLRAAWWALRAARAARRRLAEGGIEALAVPAPPALPYAAKTGIELVFRLCVRNCLLRAAVRQAWYRAHGRDVDLVIGVSAPGGDFRAHAWLAGDPLGEDATFTELFRRPSSQIVAS